MALVVRADFHCEGSRRVKVESRSPASSRLSATARHLSRHLRRKALRRFSISAGGVGIDHVAVVLGQFIVHVLGGMRQEVAVLVNRAALDRQVLAPQSHERGFQTRGAVALEARLWRDDHKFGPLQAACVQIVEELAPRGDALPAHVPDGQQHLLTVAAHADGSRHRDVRGLAVQPGS
jgi:hypothetical protein